jgi:lipopolysaccharide heptosyltransferase I
MDMRILLVKLSAIGDVIQALPVLAALRRRYPDAHLSWVVDEAASDLLCSHPMLNEVIIYPRRRFGKLGSNLKRWPTLIKEAVDFVIQLRGKNYDVVIDLQGLLKSGVLTGFSRGICKLGFANGREWSSIFLTDKLPGYDPDEHAVLRYLRLASYLDANVNRPEFPLAIAQADKEKMDQLLKQAGIEGRPLLCLNPGATWETKKWTPKGFAEVADGCFERWNAVSIIVGGLNDKDVACNVAMLAKHPVIDFTGLTSLKTLAALYQRARAVVSTDTGPMHLAAASGAPVVALFGPTAPWRTGPFGSVKQVIRLGLSCSPCFKRQCPDPKCMTNISSEQVIEAVKKIGKFGD